MESAREKRLGPPQSPGDLHDGFHEIGRALKKLSLPYLAAIPRSMASSSSPQVPRVPNRRVFPDIRAVEYEKELLPISHNAASENVDPVMR
jgi:hypothetical protein